MAMYLLDPDVGPRRRGMVRDKSRHARCALEGALDKGSRDLAHRTNGFFARMRALLRKDEPPERVIEARVRTELGRVVSHPSSIEVLALPKSEEFSVPIQYNLIVELCSK